MLSCLPCAADIYDKVSGEMQKKGYSCECLGGGRISHQSQDKKIHVYGYSMVSPQLGRGLRNQLSRALTALHPEACSAGGSLGCLSCRPRPPVAYPFPTWGGREVPACPSATGGLVLFLHEAWRGHHCRPALGCGQFWGEAQRPLPLLQATVVTPSVLAPEIAL